jgi:hypothetical protein
MADVFLSYAHADNQHLSFVPTGLISRLHDDLETWAAMSKDPKPDVWRDAKRLEVGELFNPAISEKLKEARVFLPIVSPNWLKSDYCQREFRAFWDRTGAGQSGDSRTGVIPVLLTYRMKDVDALKEPFRSLSFSEELRYDLAMPQDLYQRFFGALTTAISERLQRIPPVQPAASGPRVFMAHAVGETGEPLKKAREVIANELITKEFEVVDGIYREKYKAEDIVGEISRSVPSCLAAIHFFGDNLGPILKGDPRQVVQLQFEEVSRLKPRLQIGYSLPGFKANSDDEEFMQKARKALGTDYWQMEPQKCAANLVERLRKLLNPPPELPSDNAVYVMYDSTDRDAGAAVEAYLDNLGFEILRVPKEGLSDEEYIKEHQENLLFSQWFYIYHGKAPAEGWSDIKRNETIRAKKKKESRIPFKGVVYLGPEDNPSKQTFKSKGCL